MIMNVIATHSTPGDSKWAIEASLVENPPVATVVIACRMASNPFMPTAP